MIVLYPCEFPFSRHFFLASSFLPLLPKPVLPALPRSVTRNPGAVISDPRRALPTRVPSSLTTEDIPGARPRSLPPRPRQEFYETRDVEGAQPKPLHREVRYTPGDVEGAFARARLRFPRLLLLLTP